MGDEAPVVVWQSSYAEFVQAQGFLYLVSAI